MIVNNIKIEKIMNITIISIILLSCLITINVSFAAPLNPNNSIKAAITNNNDDIELNSGI